MSFSWALIVATRLAVSDGGYIESSPPITTRRARRPTAAAAEARTVRGQPRVS